jgi:signal transduction histidine kinase/ligand-binding sensor domain-containing protein/AraC-like DNA-binding protein
MQITIKPRFKMARRTLLHGNAFVKAFIVWVICYLFPRMAYAQPINPNFRNISINDGLSDTQIKCISQDKKGFMWFGTPYGLNKYDGNGFTQYLHNPSNKKTIDHNNVTSIFEDSSQRMWIGTESSLNYFNRTIGVFENVIKKQEGIYRSEMGAVKKIAEDEQGRLWLARTHGLQVYDPNNKTIRTFLPKDEDNGFLGEIGDLIIDKKGKLWVATMVGIRYFDRNSFKFSNPLNDFAPSPPVSVAFESRILEDRKGGLWYATRGVGLQKYQSFSGTWKRYQYSANLKNGLSSNFINDIVEDKQGNIWIATGRSGLDFFDPISEKFSNLSKSRIKKNCLISNALSRLFIDKEQQLWIGTWHNGLDYLKRNSDFLHYSMDGTAMSLSSNNVMGIVDAEKGNLWVGLDDGGGLEYIDRERNKITSIKIPTDKNFTDYGEQSVKSMIKSRTGDLWIGTMNGLYTYNPNTKNWQSFSHDPNNVNSLNSGFINAILEDHLGNIWVATRAQGLSKYDIQSKIWSRLVDKEEAYRNFKGIEVLYEDHENIIWAGTALNGLWSFNTATNKPTFFKKNMDQNHNSKLGISAIIENATNQLFVGTTGNGLQIIDKDSQRINAITEAEGLSGNMVFGIIESQKGLWISTNKGLSLYDNKKGILMNYYGQNGLQKGPFFKNSFAKLSTGEFSFGGVNGLNIFDPSKLPLETKKVPLEITSLLLFDEKTATWSSSNIFTDHFRADDKLTLSYKEPVFKFIFTALSYDDSRTNYYAYRLYPYEKIWQQAGNKREANYANLPAGQYTFQVKTSRSEKQWDNDFKSIEVTIEEKPWLTWWAFVMYALLAFTCVYFLRKFEMARILTRNALQLERMTHQKDNEVYQTKYNFFTNITHELRTPLTMIVSPLENMISSSNGRNKSVYRVMHRNALKLHQLIDQLLDIRKMELVETNLKASKGDIIIFSKQVLDSFQELAKIKNISLNFYAEFEQHDLWFDSDKMEKILNNLISNALKFTPTSGKITLSVKKNTDQNLIELALKDNGLGISKNHQNKIFDRFYKEDVSNENTGYGIGLAFTKELTELHHGKIVVNSTENIGSTFSCYFPMGNSHLKPEEIVSTDLPDKAVIESNEMCDNWGMNTSEIKKGLPTLLIVEDSQDIQEYISSHLANNYNILKAFNGKYALEILNKQQVDLIISDVIMPEMDGISLCEQVKTNLNTSHIPVILLSALSSVKNRISGIEAGADSYVPKPFNLEILKAEVANLIKSREVLRRNFLSFENFQIKSFSPSIKDENFITEVIKIIDKHLDNSNFEKEDLLREANMSHSSMYRKLKSLTNLSPNEFIRKIRLQRSMNMLSDPDLNISQVAYSVGFSDPKYFSLCFRKAFKISPTEFKDKISKQKEPEVMGFTVKNT